MLMESNQNDINNLSEPKPGEEKLEQKQSGERMTRRPGGMGHEADRWSSARRGRAGFSDSV